MLRWQELNKRQHDIHLRALKTLGFFFPAGLESISKNVNLVLEVRVQRLDMEADMLEKIIETLDPKAQKHDQSRTQTDITPKMTYHSKTKCFSLGPSCIRTGSCQSFWVFVISRIG